MQDNGLERLKDLMDGKGGERYVIYDDSQKLYRNFQRSQLIMAWRLLIAVSIAVVVMAIINYAKNPPPATYNFNPVSKIVLKAKAGSYMEENYPEYEKDMHIDTNTGMIKNKSGYTVVYKDDQGSKIIIYFDRDYNVKNALPQIKPSE